jgi:hypothetical protein
MRKERKYETILVIAGGMIVFYFIFRIMLFLIIAIAVISIGLFSNYLTIKIHWVWSKLALALGYLSSYLFLFIIFYFILTPLALLRKIVTKRNTTHNSTSNYTERNHLYEKADMEKPW